MANTKHDKVRGSNDAEIQHKFNLYYIFFIWTLFLTNIFHNWLLCMFNVYVVIRFAKDWLQDTIIDMVWRPKLMTSILFVGHSNSSSARWYITRVQATQTPNNSRLSHAVPHWSCISRACPATYLVFSKSLACRYFQASRTCGSKAHGLYSTQCSSVLMISAASWACPVMTVQYKSLALILSSRDKICAQLSKTGGISNLQS